jgi:hypothetical protein
MFVYAMGCIVKVVLQVELLTKFQECRAPVSISLEITAFEFTLKAEVHGPLL